MRRLFIIFVIVYISANANAAKVRYYKGEEEGSIWTGALINSDSNVSDVVFISEPRPLNLPKKFKSIDLAQYIKDFSGYPQIRFYNERILKKYEEANCVKDIKKGAECSSEVESECIELLLECGPSNISFHISLENKEKSRLSAIKKDRVLYILSTSSEELIRASKVDHSIADSSGNTDVDIIFPKEKIKKPLQSVKNMDDVIYFKIGNEAFGLQNSSQLRTSFGRFLKDCRMD